MKASEKAAHDDAEEAKRIAQADELVKHVLDIARNVSRLLAGEVVLAWSKDEDGVTTAAFYEGVRTR